MGEHRYLLVIDVGTSAGRSIIFDDCGTQVAHSRHEWSHRADPRYPGSLDFDCRGNWVLLCQCIRASLAQAGIAGAEVAAVSATSMRHGIACYDARGEEIFAVPNVDARAEEDTAALVHEGWGPKIYEIQGDWPNIHALARLRWLRAREPRTFANVRMVTMLSDWVVRRLSGEFSTEPSVASSSGLFDIRTRRWSAPLVELAGLGLDCLPGVKDSGTRVGEVTAAAAGQTGLEAGTPVMAGMGDTQAGYVGSGVIAVGQAGIVAGTFWLPSIIAREPTTDPERRTRTNCHAMRDQWIIESCTFFTGFSIRWYRDAFCQEEVEKARALGKDPFELMEELARGVPPGSHGMHVILSDVANNSRWAHAAPAFQNFNITEPGKFNRATFYRAILENAAYQVLGEMENITRVYGQWPAQVVFSGGGANSPLICQIIADTLGIPVVVPVVREASALGTAMAAAAGIGLYAGIEQSCAAFVRYERTYEPHADTGRIYRDAYHRWRELYPYHMEMMHKGLTQPMWRAPAT